MTSKSPEAAPQGQTPLPQPLRPVVNTITAQDITDALKDGFADFLARPVMSGFFGLFYAVFGLFFVWSLIWLEQLWMITPAVIGFPLIAPFAAAGLYEMSRRMQRNEAFGWSDIMTVMARQRRREMGWMAVVTLFVFWIWVYQVRLWLAVILKDASFSSFGGFLDVVFFTWDGWMFLAIGTAAGAGLCAVLFTLTVVAMPILLDRELDFVTAMLTSVRAVLENPVVMLTWAAIISVTMLISLAPAFLGLIFTLPILGHTTWHLYRRVVTPVDGTQTPPSA